MQTNDWYVILTLPQCERAAVAGLVARGFKATIMRRQRSGRRDKDGRDILRNAEVPMFPGYAFVREVTDRDRRSALCLACAISCEAQSSSYWLCPYPANRGGRTRGLPRGRCAGGL